jgi:hypothetical protein
VAAETVDPLLQAWQVAWDGHALLHQPLDWFQANVFYPLPNSLAFSDALIGYTPAGLIGSGPKAALMRYDLLFVLSYALAFTGAYALARELGLGGAAPSSRARRLPTHRFALPSGRICTCCPVAGFRSRSRFCCADIGAGVRGGSSGDGPWRRGR